MAIHGVPSKLELHFYCFTWWWWIPVSMFYTILQKGMVI